MVNIIKNKESHNLHSALFKFSNTYNGLAYLFDFSVSTNTQSRKNLYDFKTL
jgi:hypothetical protein